MKDKIQAIEEVSEIILDEENKELYELEWCVKYEGWRITTRTQQILVLLDQGQACCETFGYAASEDRLDDFLGANLVGVEIMDGERKALELERFGFQDGGPKDLYDGDAVFVRFMTDRGPFVLTVYNSQNGYYGHDVRIIARGIDFTGTV